MRNEKAAFCFQQTEERNCGDRRTKELHHENRKKHLKSKRGDRPIVKKRLLSMLLSLCILFSAVPVAFAAQHDKRLCPGGHLVLM